MAQPFEIPALALRLCPARELRIATSGQQAYVILGRPPVDHLVHPDIKGRVSVVGDATPVGEQERHLTLQGTSLLNPEPACDGRGAAVSAEHPLGADPLAALEHDASNRVLWRSGTDQVDYPFAEAPIRPGGKRRVEDRIVERDASRRCRLVKAVDRREAAGDLVAEADDSEVEHGHLVGSE